jgi:uncharacterized protein (TIGR02466 family)|tara:strand:+ start:155 stop:790 length:636 start_codon:yes stop_codon:yes gene_type:complete
MAEEHTREVRHYAFGPLITQQDLQPDIVTEMKAMASRAQAAKVEHNEYLAGMIAQEWRFTPEDNAKLPSMLGPHIEEYIKQGMSYTSGDYTALIRDGVPVLQQTWVNFMKAGEFNPPHTHGGLISTIIYLDIPNRIKREMKKNKGNSLPGAVSFRWGESQPLSINLAAAAPQPGEMYIFPAHVEHSVNPFYSKGTRISVSSNWQIGPKNHG